MSSFDFNIIQHIDSPEFLQSGFYLWIWYADKIPPHVGCSSNGKYFSLKVNGKDENIEVSKVFSIIQRKKLAAVLVKVKSEYSSDAVNSTYLNFHKAETGKNTCLSPITQLLDCSDDIFQLSDLLIYLKNNKEIESVFGLNLKSNYKGIPPYTKEDIENRLRKLENAKSQKNIPSVG